MFVCRAESSEKILRCTANLKSFHRKIDTCIVPVDEANHEIGKVIQMLVNGNVNFIWGLTSPIIKYSTPWHKKLIRIYLDNIAKNCFYSIRGMVVHTIKKYQDKGKIKEKRWNMMARTLDLGIAILDKGKIEYKSFTGACEHVVQDKLNILLCAYNSSSLPEKPDEKPYEDFLYDLRISDFRGKL
jgi:hypothetical protein